MTTERSIIIGDIHGCCRTLEALLSKIGYDPGDRIIFVGDYIDRGPHIRETLEFLIRLQEQAAGRAVFLMGNHEQMLLDVAEKEWDGYRFFEHPARDTDTLRRPLTYFIDGCRLWLSNGGTETEKQIFSLDRTVYDRYLEWMSGNLFYDYRDPEGRFSVTHAGAEYGVELDDDWTKVWNRSGAYDGPLVICGHTPVASPSLSGKFLWQEYAECGKWYDLPLRGTLDIDTACVFERTLTAMIIEGRRFCLESAAYCE